MTKLYASFSPKNNVVLAEGLEPTCDQLPFLQGISLRGYARMVSASAFTRGCGSEFLEVYIVIS